MQEVQKRDEGKKKHRERGLQVPEYEASHRVVIQGCAPTSTSSPSPSDQHQHRVVIQGHVHSAPHPTRG